ncbi:MAG: hypothetical protein JKY22_11620 [Flavobacteriaceae bacterium]|nr:hypothetical protein [Flavobacteriaceae bacterium]
MVIGAMGHFVHRGLFGTSEYRTIIPILAILTSNFNPIKGALLSFSLIVFSQLILFISPSIGEVELANYSTALIIFFLVFMVFIRNIPKGVILNARIGHFFPMRIKEVFSFRLNKNALLSYTFFLLISFFALLMNVKFSKYLSDEDFSRTILIVALVMLTYLIHRFLNVMTISISMLGSLCAYIVYYWIDSPLYLLFFLIALACVACIYLIVLRLVKEDLALLIDLATLVGLHEFIKQSTFISGSDEVLSDFPTIVIFETKFLFYFLLLLGRLF